MIGIQRDEPTWVARHGDMLHFEQLAEHGGAHGVRDENALESARARPRQPWSYEPESDFAVLAAAYAYGIGRSHPFVDGNKRSAFMTAYVFLGLNGYDLTISEADVESTMGALAGGAIDERHWAMRYHLPDASPRSRDLTSRQLLHASRSSSPSLP